MFGVIRGFSQIRVAPILRGSNIAQRANIVSKPAKHVVGPVETVVGLGLFSLAILVPSGWILANLDSYKKK